MLAAHSPHIVPLPLPRAFSSTAVSVAEDLVNPAPTLAGALMQVAKTLSQAHMCTPEHNCF